MAFGCMTSSKVNYSQMPLRNILLSNITEIETGYIHNLCRVFLSGILLYDIVYIAIVNIVFVIKMVIFCDALKWACFEGSPDRKK